MPQPSLRRALKRASDGERIFSDADGRLWSAVKTREAQDGALVFQCVSDSREAARAIAADDGVRMAELPDETLRLWLDAAPRVGRLT
jgi:hypothetical protein